MSSVVQICNQALANIRGGEINSIDESSVQARYCKLKFDDVRDTVLRDGSWNFATEIAPLAVRTDDVFNWLYCYQYPSDCLKLQRLILNWEEFTQDDGAYRTRAYRTDNLVRADLRRKVTHKVMHVGGSKVIVANEPDLRVQYTKQITDVNMFDVTFRQAIVHLLASELCVPIIGVQNGLPLKNAELALYQNYLNASIDNDGNENYEEQPDSDFIIART